MSLPCAEVHCDDDATTVVFTSAGAYCRCDWHPSLLEALPGALVQPLTGCGCVDGIDQD